jgi:hypothetical protein
VNRACPKPTTWQQTAAWPKTTSATANRGPCSTVSFLYRTLAPCKIPAAPLPAPLGPSLRRSCQGVSPPRAPRAARQGLPLFTFPHNMCRLYSLPSLHCASAPKAIGASPSARTPPRTSAPAEATNQCTPPSTLSSVTPPPSPQELAKPRELVVFPIRGEARYQLPLVSIHHRRWPFCPHLSSLRSSMEWRPNWFLLLATPSRTDWFGPRLSLLQWEVVAELYEVQGAPPSSYTHMPHPAVVVSRYHASCISTPCVASVLQWALAPTTLPSVLLYAPLCSRRHAHRSSSTGVPLQVVPPWRPRPWWSCGACTCMPCHGHGSASVVFTAGSGQQWWALVHFRPSSCGIFENLLRIV